MGLGAGLAGGVVAVAGFALLVLFAGLVVGACTRSVVRGAASPS